MSDRARVHRRLPSARALIALAAQLLATAWLTGCSPDRTVGPGAELVGTLAPNAAHGASVAADSGPPLSLESLTPASFPTYDGSGQVAHPDIAFFPDGWRGQRYWAGITPYPNSNRAYENPSMFTSDDGAAWSVPAGLRNPVMRTRRGHLSDPDVVHNPRTKELWLYYREAVFKRGRHAGDNFFLTRSADGVRWSAPSLLATHSRRYVVSPTVAIGPDGKWRMWAVDAGVVGCSARASRVVARRSPDGVRWSAAHSVRLGQPGYVAWHLDVQYIASRGEYWALIAAYAQGSGCGATDLFFATSRDGDSWTTYAAPVLGHGAVWEFSANVYRSSLIYYAERDAVSIWLTGARVTFAGEEQTSELRWSAAVARVGREALLARVNAPAPVRAASADQAYLRQAATVNALP